jgi:hypothetical protein
MLRFGAVVAVALAAGFIAWLVLGRGSDSEPAGQTTITSTTTLSGRVPTSAVATPSIASPSELRAVAAATTIPIYWVGARNGTKIELTRAPGGTVFIRYLPPQARAGDSQAFLTVATYPRPKAYAEVRRAARSSKSRTIALAGGGIAVYDPGHPTNVHIAYPTQPYQIEVFSPQHGTALKLVESGAVRPVD